MKRDMGRVDCERAPCQVGRAEPACLDDLATIFDQYRQFYGQKSDRAGARQFLSERLNAEDSVIFVAKLAEITVGFVQLYPSYSSVAMRRVWILNDLFVLPDYRRASIGRRLLDVAVEHGLSTDAARLVLSTQVENGAAKSLYAGHGWVRDTVFDHYSRSIDSE